MRARGSMDAAECKRAVLRPLETLHVSEVNHDDV